MSEASLVTPGRARPLTRPASTAAHRQHEHVRAVVTTLAVAAITLAGSVLRLVGVGALSLRLDEAQSIEFASRPVSMGGLADGRLTSLYAATAADVHPPGYLLLLHGVMARFGTSITTLRLPAVVAGILCIPAMFLLARALYSREVALIASLLAALSPFWIWHSQEVRMYSILLLFSVLCAYGFVQAIVHRRDWGWSVYAAAAVGGLYTHYFMFLVLLSLAVVVMMQRRHLSRRQVLGWCAASALTAVLYAPWMVYVVLHHTGATDPTLQAPNAYTPLVFLTEFVLGYLSVPVTSRIVAAWPVLVLLALVLGGFARSSARGRILWPLFVVPVAVALVTSVFVLPVASERYLIICTPALFVLMAVAISRVPQRVLRMAILGGWAAVLLVALQYARGSSANPAAEDYRTVVEYIQSHAGPGDAVALDAGFNQFPYSYYADNNLPTYELPRDQGASGPTSAAPALPSLAERLRGIEAGRTHLWVVYYLENRGALDRRGPRPDPVRRYLAYHTSANTVIVGSADGRGLLDQPASLVTVQLVRYDLIPAAAGPVQIRPATVAQLRSLSGLSPTTRRPFAAADGAPGARSTLLGPELPAAPPSRQWSFPSLSGATRERRLDLFNPNPFPTSVSVIPTAGGGASVEVTIPAFSNADISLGGPGGVSGPGLSLTGGGPFVATQWGWVGDQAVVENGFPRGRLVPRLVAS